MKNRLPFLLTFISIYSFAQEIPVYDSLNTTIDIDAVIVKAQKKRLYADKSVYTFDKEALEAARYTNDLLRSLPELQYDPIGNKISGTKGGTTLVLINGVEATDLQIKTIQPQNVVKVEYYDVPPTRWATRADTLVNIITRNPETGYVFGADITSALNTGFVNASAYGNYTKGKNNFGVEYSLNLRDYNDRRVNRVYDYFLNGSHYNTNAHEVNHFGYTDQNITLRYTNTDSGNYAFQALFNINIWSYFSKGKGESIFTQDTHVDEHSTTSYDDRKYAIPTLDLYFSKNISKKEEISFNIVGSAYTTKNFESDREWNTLTHAPVFDNEMTLRARQKSIVGEVAYANELKAGKLSLGYRISNNNVSNDLTNLVGSTSYDVNYLQQYIYTEFAGKKNKWMYRVGAGLTNIHNKSAEMTEDSWTFTPKVIVGYQLTKNQSLRLTSSYAPVSPGSSALSSNVVQVAPNIVSKGNPLLKSMKKWNNSLLYSFNNKYFDFTTNLFYDYTDRVINQYYVNDDILGGYALTYENGQFATRAGVQFSGSIRPFGSSVLVIKAVVTPTSEKVKTFAGNEIKNNYVENYFVVSSEYKNFYLQYQFNIPVFSLSGAFLQTNENQNNIFAYYKHNNWTFGTGMYWLGMPSRYKTKSLPESLVNYNNLTEIYNNKSMFVLSLAYDFAKGKKTHIEKKLNNDTAPAATF